MNHHVETPNYKGWRLRQQAAATGLQPKIHLSRYALPLWRRRWPEIAIMIAIAALVATGWMAAECCYSTGNVWVVVPK